MSNTFKKYLQKITEIVKVLLLILAGLLILIVLLLLFPPVQNYIAGKAVRKLEQKLDTKIALGGVRVILPNSVTLHNLYIEDQDKDTLLNAGLIKVNVGLFGLLKKNIVISRVNLKNITGKIKRARGDSTFNFSFIPRAFSGSGKTSAGASPYTVSVKQIKLSNIDFRYDDGLTRNLVNSYIGDFTVWFKKFNLNPLVIDVSHFRLDRSHASMVLAGGSTTTTGGTSPRLYLQKKSVLTDIAFYYKNLSTGQVVNIRQADLSVNPEKVDISGEQIHLKRIALQHADISLNAGTPGTGKGNSAAGPAGPFSWDISADKLILADNAFSYDVDTAGMTPGRVNFSHLGLNDIGGSASDIIINRDGYVAMINRFSLRDRSGFVLSNLSGRAEIRDTTIQLSNFRIITPRTNILNNSSLRFPSLANIIGGPAKTYFDVSFSKSKISPRDIGYFAPALSRSLPPAVKSRNNVALDTRIGGYITKTTGYHSELDISHLAFGAGDSLLLSLRGTARGLPDVKTTDFNLKIDTVLVYRDDIKALLPDSTVPSSIHLPMQANLHGNFKGRLNDFTTGFLLHSTQGNMKATLSYNGGTAGTREKYAGNIEIRGYDIGKLLNKPDTLGKLSLSGHFKGTSRKFKDPDASFDVDVSHLGAYGYNYHDIKLSGVFANHIFNGNASVDDTNLVAKFSGKASLKDTVPQFDFTMDVEGMDAHAIHLTSQDIRLKGSLRANFIGGNIDGVNGYLKAYNAMVVRNGNFYPLDSIILKATNTAQQTGLDLTSQFINASYKGSVGISKLPGLMRNYLNYYFNLHQDNTNMLARQGNFTFQADILNTDLLSEIFLPQLKDFAKAQISANYSGSKPSFTMSADFPAIDYKGYVIDTFNVNVTSDKNQISWTAGLGHAYSGPFEVPPIDFKGTISGGTINWDLVSKVQKNADLYHLSGYMRSRDKSFYLGLDTTKLILNKTPFFIPEGNYLKFSGQGIESHDFILHSGTQKISLSGGVQGDNLRGITIKFADFNINNFTALLSGGKNNFSASMDGQFGLAGNGTFNSDLTLDEVSLDNENVFHKVILQAGNESGGKLNFSVNLDGDKNNLKFTGSIGSGKAPKTLSVTADIKRLDLSSFASFFPSRVQSLKGILSGNLKAGNTLSDPRVSGSLAFNDVSVTPVFTGTVVHLKNDRILFNKRTIDLNKFILTDEAGNTMTLNGSIDASDMRNPLFNLTLNTPKFEFLNTGKESRNMFYGHLVAGIDARIKGNISNPDINLTTNLGYDSHFYFIVPETGTASIEQQGVVEFIQKKNDTVSNILTRKVKADTTISTSIRNLNLTANISMTKSMKLTIVIDPATNEELEVQGAGNLSYSLKSNGQMTLAGGYLVDEGSYSLTLYDVLKRKFDIEKGSSLTWTGEVSNPRIDLTTWYPVKTSPEPIIAPQMTSMSQSQSLQYQGNMDFNVYMYIKGNLMQPSISFEIKQPPAEQDANIQARLSQLNSNESELNKQVFSLLLFDSFLQENALSQNSFAYNLNSTARKGVGNILAQQINRFAQAYIPGFNFNVNINSYQGNASGRTVGNTNVEMNVSKQLLNKRLSIQVGGNVNIQDNNPNTTSLANVNNLAGDVVVEYKLTPDGVYRIQAFNKNEYEDVLDGQLNKTGVAFIFNRDFYSFKNLFKRNKDRKKQEPKPKKKKQ